MESAEKTWETMTTRDDEWKSRENSFSWSVSVVPVANARYELVRYQILESNYERLSELESFDNL